jgi:hypothetical protein
MLGLETPSQAAAVLLAEAAPVNDGWSYFLEPVGGVVDTLKGKRKGTRLKKLIDGTAATGTVGVDVQEADLRNVDGRQGVLEKAEDDADAREVSPGTVPLIRVPEMRPARLRKSSIYCALTKKEGDLYAKSETKFDCAQGGGGLFSCC